MEKLRFDFFEDGSCQVSNEQGLWTWSRDQVVRTREVARVCCQSRRAGPCDCTACQLMVAEREWRDQRPQYILFSTEEGPRPRVDDDGMITTDGVMGRIGPDNIYLNAYAKWPRGAKRLADLEVGERIKDVEYRLSGEKATYDVYRVK
jgi:hypothetical protein